MPGPAIGNAGAFVATLVGTVIAHPGLIEIGSVAVVANYRPSNTDSGGLTWPPPSAAGVLGLGEIAPAPIPCLGRPPFLATRRSTGRFVVAALRAGPRALRVADSDVPHHGAVRRSS
jgi:hypothetical protein